MSTARHTGFGERWGDFMEVNSPGKICVTLLSAVSRAPSLPYTRSAAIASQFASGGGSVSKPATSSSHENAIDKPSTSI
jgi:hypothetical protein